MQAKEYRTVDKSTWERGPWDDEPDKMQWSDPATGLPCLIVRNGFGSLCGYVGVPVAHPLHGKTYEGLDIDVHCGLTFSDYCFSDDEERGVCHVPAPGEPDNVWWLGFDCGHGGDQQPAMEARARSAGFPPLRGHYRDVLYVRSLVTKLAAQLAAS